MRTASANVDVQLLLMHRAHRSGTSKQEDAVMRAKLNICSGEELGHSRCFTLRAGRFGAMHARR